MDQATTLGIYAGTIVLFFAFALAFARWQERKHGHRDNSPEE